MGKFDFVNQDLVVNDRVRVTEPPTIVKNENTKNYRTAAAIVILLLALGIGVFFVAMLPKITKKTSDQH